MASPEPFRPWHALLAPLPADARPRRKPVAPPEVLAGAADSPIAGWTSVTLELSDSDRGLRHLLVTLDETGRPISASDHVLFRLTGSDGTAGRPEIRQESIGGRLEADGTFRGTCWLVTGPEREDDDTPPDWDMRSRLPEARESEALKALVAELLLRLET